MCTTESCRTRTCRRQCWGKLSRDRCQLARCAGSGDRAILTGTTLTDKRGNRCKDPTGPWRTPRSGKAGRRKSRTGAPNSPSCASVRYVRRGRWGRRARCIATRHLAARLDAEGTCRETGTDLRVVGAEATACVAAVGVEAEAAGLGDGLPRAVAVEAPADSAAPGAVAVRLAGLLHSAARPGDPLAGVGHWRQGAARDGPGRRAGACCREGCCREGDGNACGKLGEAVSDYGAVQPYPASDWP